MWATQPIQGEQRKDVKLSQRSQELRKTGLVYTGNSKNLFRDLDEAGRSAQSRKEIGPKRKSFVS